MELKHIPEVVPLTGTRSTDSQSEEENNERGRWGSQVEYILSVIGYSVGLGNVWRFPYICNRNGGGAFLIPFLVCLILTGLPLFFLEAAIGQFSAKGPVHVWSLCPVIKGMGIGMIVISIIHPLYYSVVCTWSLYYAVFSCREVLPWTSCDNTWNTESCVTSVRLLKPLGDMNSTITHNNSSTTSEVLTTRNTSLTWDNVTFSHTATEEFWQYNVLSITKGFGDFGKIRWELALCHLAIWCLLLLCIIKGVKSLGKAVYITATLPYVILAVLLVRGLTLPGGVSGILYFITPDFSKILTVQPWIEASVQVFYSLGPTWGGLIIMSSFNKFHTNCLRNTLICTIWGEGTSLFAGLVVFSIIGFMAQEADVPITDVVSSGPGLAFVIYPEALSQLPLPQLWNFIFFIMLIFLALDSIFCLIEAVVCSFLDEFPSFIRWRVLITALYCLVSCLISLVFTTEGGVYLFQLSDWYCSALFPMLTGVLECVVLGWVYGVKRFSDDIEMMIGKQAPVFFKITWCYITPIVLTITFVFMLCQYKPPTYGKYVYPEHAAAIGWCIACLPLIPIVLTGFKVVCKGQGSFLQRLRKSLSPDITWEPVEKSYRKMYQEKYVKRRISIKDACFASVSCKS